MKCDSLKDVPFWNVIWLSPKLNYVAVTDFCEYNYQDYLQQSINWLRSATNAPYEEIFT